MQRSWHRRLACAACEHLSFPGVSSCRASSSTVVPRATATMNRVLVQVSPMAESSSPDHDQRLKVLLKAFFEQFFLCFFPVWAARFDFREVTWLDKEIFLAPPQGD